MRSPCSHVSPFHVCGAPVARGAEPVGEVQDLKGEAFADAVQQHRTLEKNSPVYVGDRISTGPASRLTMHRGRYHDQLGEKTQLVIDQFLPETGGEISLEVRAYAV